MTHRHFQTLQKCNLYFPAPMRNAAAHLQPHRKNKPISRNSRNNQTLDTRNKSFGADANSKPAQPHKETHSHQQHPAFVFVCVCEPVFVCLCVCERVFVCLCTDGCVYALVCITLQGKDDFSLLSSSFKQGSTSLTFRHYSGDLFVFLRWKSCPPSPPLPLSISLFLTTFLHSFINMDC